MDLTERLLDLAAAVTWDGGERVMSSLRRHLTDLVVFDLGELAMPRVIGFDRWALSDSEEELVPEDLLTHLVDRDEPLRIDDVSALVGFDRSVTHLVDRDIRSLLALPLSSARGPRGTVVLTRDSTWAFAGAPLPALGSLAGMAGLSLETAAMLTKLRRDGEALHATIERLRKEAERPRMDAVRAGAASPTRGPRGGGAA